MKVTLESTSKIVTLEVNGVDVPARIWEGHTERGIPCHAFVTRIAGHKDADLSEFERELVETCPPRADLNSIPLRMIL